MTALWVAPLLSSAVAVDLSNLAAHPRLMMTPDRVSDVLKMNQTDSYYREILRGLKASADSSIKTPITLSSATSWSSNIRLEIATVSGMYLLTNDTEYADYVIEGILLLSNLSDWDPSNFLYTADICMTIAIGYDWVYDRMSEAQLEIVEKALMEKGMVASMNTSLSTWGSHTNNWAQVCPTGLIMASLAIGDKYEALAEEVIEYSFERLKVSLEGYAPDGGWYEGYNYGTYANMFLAMLTLSLSTSLNDDLGISALPGISDIGSWLTYGYGQVGGFSWGDGAWIFTNANVLWCTGYWARLFGKPAWLQGMLSHFTVPEVVNYQAYFFYDSADTSTDSLAELSLGYQWENVAGVTYRESWSDNTTWFFGLMGGFNGRSHGHLDAGSFVVDFKQYRWAELLGSDSYSLSGYFTGAQRWSYYRCRTEGANTLSISTEDQVPLQLANQIPSSNNSLLRAGSFGNSTYFGVVNLTEAYQNVTTSVMRGVALLSDSQFLVRDEIRSSWAVDIVANWHTTADVVISTDTRTASLTQGDVTMIATVLSPDDAFFVLISTNPCSAYSGCKEMTNDGIYNLAVRLSDKTTAANISVSLTETGHSVQSFDVPLSSWSSLCVEDCSQLDNIGNPSWLENAEEYF
ncbi:Heparinase II/III family protein [Penicillium nucicola]|uniref:Heparinase II/III family protein n=1 Tax=Penicillium nucicola TaxID=1850975 RepID=UPI0025450236|nr:Heparinase II/III family protein [Penicillium nucicola]KAJ5747327.1 Heparinase II/III family protein [Penicillium nucicola]